MPRSSATPRLRGSPGSRLPASKCCSRAPALASRQTSPCRRDEMSDPIAEFIRAEREALLQAAPAPHAARLWHEARRRRADSLRRSLSAIGWLVRVVIAAAILVSSVYWRPETYF